MARRFSSFKVGLFVLIGTALGLGAMIWLGASDYMDRGRDYVTFFNQSVQGLQKDSVVKYKGVDVGRVTDIRVAPDYRLIEVVMNIRFEGDLSKEMIAQLKSVGITGIAFIELDNIQPGDRAQSPEITFAAEHPIIPSKPSEISRILGVIDDIAKQLKQIDFGRMAGRVDQILAGSAELLEKDRMARIMDNVEQAASHARGIIARADDMLSKVKIDKVFDDTEVMVGDAKQTLAEARQLLRDLREALKGMALTERSQQVGQVADDAGQVLKRTDRLLDDAGWRTMELLDSLRTTGENLTRTSAALERLVGQLERNPSQIIFSSPPAPRGGSQ